MESNLLSVHCAASPCCQQHDQRCAASLFGCSRSIAQYDARDRVGQGGAAGPELSWPARWEGRRGERRSGPGPSRARGPRGPLGSLWGRSVLCPRGLSLAEHGQAGQRGRRRAGRGASINQRDFSQRGRTGFPPCRSGSTNEPRMGPDSHVARQPGNPESDSTTPTPRPRLRLRDGAWRRVAAQRK